MPIQDRALLIQKCAVDDVEAFGEFDEPDLRVLWIAMRVSCCPRTVNGDEGTDDVVVNLYWQCPKRVGNRALGCVGSLMRQRLVDGKFPSHTTGLDAGELVTVGNPMDQIAVRVRIHKIQAEFGLEIGADYLENIAGQLAIFEWILKELFE